MERSVHEMCLALIKEGLVVSAHDCSEGGLGVALAESCISHPDSPQGAELHIESTMRNDACLFGESQSRIIVSFPEKHRTAVEEKAKTLKVPFAVIGKVGGDSLVVNINEEEFIREEVSTLKELWMGALESHVG